MFLSLFLSLWHIYTCFLEHMTFWRVALTGVGENGSPGGETRSFSEASRQRFACPGEFRCSCAKIQTCNHSSLQRGGSSRRLNVKLEGNQDICKKTRMGKCTSENNNKYDGSKNESVIVKTIKQKNLEFQASSEDMDMEMFLLLWIYRVWSGEKVSILTACCWLSIMDLTRRNWQDTLWRHRGGSLLVTFNRNCKISCLVAKWKSGPSFLLHQSIWRPYGADSESWWWW